MRALDIKLSENNIERCYVKYDLCETTTLTENELIKEVCIILKNSNTVISAKNIYS